MNEGDLQKERLTLTLSHSRLINTQDKRVSDVKSAFSF